MKKIGFAFLVAFILVLVCCGGTLKILAYTSDLIDIASGKGNAVYITATIIIESLKNEADIEFLKKNLNSFSNEQIVKYNYSDSLSFDIKIPILNIANVSAHNLEKDLLYLIAEEEDNYYSFSYKFNSSLMNTIDSYVYNTYFQHIDFSNFETSIIIENDTRSVSKLTAFSVYINNQPFPFNVTRELQRRDRVELKISEVLRSAISKNNNIRYPIFRISK